MTGFFSLIFLLIVIATAALASSILLSRNTDSLYQKPYAISQYTWSIRNNLNILEKEMYKVITTNGSGSILQSTAELLSAIQKLEVLLRGSPSSLSLLEELTDSLKQLKTLQEDILKSSLDGNQRAALSLVTEAYIPLLKKASTCSDQLSTLSIESAEDFLHTSHLIKNSVICFIILITLLSIIAAFYISLFITKSIILPLKQLELVLDHFANGDLNFSIPYEGPDEIGALSHSIQISSTALKSYVENISDTLATLASGHMTISTATDYRGDFSPIGDSISHIAASLSLVLQEILQSSEQITHYSQRVYEDAESLAKSVSQQATITTDLFSTLTAITSKADANALSAVEIHSTALETAHLASIGREKIQVMTEAIDAITDAAKSIEKIVTTIDGIAHQSHLLSLNASIEAVRAGDSGLAFGVIANEMQILSQRSQSAVKETTALIQNALSVTHSGSLTVFETSQTLSQIVSFIESSQINIATIATTSKEQSASLQEATLFLGQIADTTQVVSTFAFDTLATTEHLTAYSEELKAHLSQFSW